MVTTGDAQPLELYSHVRRIVKERLEGPASSTRARRDPGYPTWQDRTRGGLSNIDLHPSHDQEAKGIAAGAEKSVVVCHLPNLHQVSLQQRLAIHHLQIELAVMFPEADGLARRSVHVAQARYTVGEVLKAVWGLVIFKTSCRQVYDGVPAFKFEGFDVSP